MVCFTSSECYKWSIMKVLFLLLVMVAAVATGDDNSPCPLWHYRPSANQSCKCGKSVHKAIICQDDGVYLRIDYAMGWNNSTNEVFVARSQFAFHNFSDVIHQVYFPVANNATMLNENMCGGNKRTDFLCGKCHPNYGPSGYSPNCVSCSDHSLLVAWLFYITIKLVPIALLFFLIMMFRIDIFQGPMLGYIIFCQILTTTIMRNNVNYQLAKHHMKNFSTVMDMSLYISAIWNLDFQQIVHPFCISDKLRYIDLRFFDVLLALFPLCLVVLTYSVTGLHRRNIRVVVYCWRPFHFCFVRLRRNWSVSNSIIHAYTSLFILSFTLLHVNGFEILRFTKVFDDKGRTDTVLFFHPSLNSDASTYVYYIFPVVFLILLLGVCPSLLLSLYPIQCMRTKLQRFCSHRLVIAMNTFIDVLQGPFKDGCNGTRDFRVLPGLMGFGVISIQVLCCVAPIVFHDKGDYILPFFAISFGILSVLCAYAKPCKSSLANLSLVYHFMSVAAMGTVATLWMNGMLDSTLLLLLLTTTIAFPHVLLLMWILYKLETRVLHVHKRAAACFNLMMGREEFGESTSQLPDRLLNPKGYRTIA